LNLCWDSSPIVLLIGHGPGVLEQGHDCLILAVFSCYSRVDVKSVSSKLELSHYRSQIEPPLFDGYAQVPRPIHPQRLAKGESGEAQVDESGGSILVAIMAPFLIAVDKCAINWCEFCNGAKGSNYFKLVRKLTDDLRETELRIKCECEALEVCKQRIILPIPGVWRRMCTQDAFKDLMDDCYVRLTGHHMEVLGIGGAGGIQLFGPNDTYVNRVYNCANAAHEVAHLKYNPICGDDGTVPEYYDCLCGSEYVANVIADSYVLFLLGVATKCFLRNL
jgi:hypothetical protein